MYLDIDKNTSSRRVFYFYFLHCSYSIVWKSLSHVQFSVTAWTIYSSWISPGQNTGVGSHSLLQGIFPTQELNQSLPHCRQILNQLSHHGSPGILEWEPIPSPCDLPKPGIEPGSPALQADSLPAEIPSLIEI